MTPTGAAILEATMERSIRLIELLGGDAVIAALPSPGWSGRARLGGVVTGYRARGADGAVLLTGPASDLRATSAFVEVGALVTLTDMEVRVNDRRD